MFRHKIGPWNMICSLWYFFAEIFILRELQYLNIYLILVTTEIYCNTDYNVFNKKSKSYYYYD